MRSTAINDRKSLYAGVAAALFFASLPLAVAQAPSELPFGPRSLMHSRQAPDATQQPTPTPPAQTAPATLPATQPTTMLAPLSVTAPAVTATRPHHAEVVFADQQLTVRANDSSLHQILSSVARATGMTITGGVSDQRVYGSYGPGDASTILATLLDGTGVNMLIREDDGHRPTQLTLSPRTGSDGPQVTATEADLGVDLPVPAAQAQMPQPSVVSRPQVQQPTQQQQQTVSGPPSMPQPLNNPLGNPANVTPTASQLRTTNSVPTDSLPTPSTAQEPAQGIVDTPNQPPAGAASPLTPDQIYQKLLQMQQQKNGATQPSAPATTPNGAATSTPQPSGSTPQ